MIDNIISLTALRNGSKMPVLRLGGQMGPAQFR